MNACLDEQQVVMKPVDICIKFEILRNLTV